MERLTSGTGNSELDDARLAGRAAATAATGGLGGGPAQLVLVYASVRYDLPELLAGVRSVTGDAPLAGFTSCGHFTTDTLTWPGQGVAVLVLSGGDYVFGVASAPGLREAPEVAGATLTRAAKAAAKVQDPDGERPHAAMILFTDGIGVDQQAVLTGVHRVGGAAVPVVGGAAADDRQMRHTSVFHGADVLNDAAVGVWVGSRRPLAVAAAHGWSPVSLPMPITSAQGLTIREIAGRPASEVFREFADHQTEKPMDDDRGLMWQASFALGLIEPDGSHLVRGAFPSAEGPLTSFTPLPPFSAVQVMTADPGSLLGVVDGVVKGAMTHGDETVLLAFDCIARLDIMGDDCPEEVARIAAAAAGADCFGSYTYGEFARARGVGGVHNATLTTLAL